MRAELVRGADIKATLDDWSVIYAADPIATPFVSPGWAQAWVDHWATKAEPWVLLVHDGSRVAGIAPLSLQRMGPVRVLGMLGKEPGDYWDVLAAPSDRVAVSAAVARELLRRRSEWDAGILNCLVPGSPTQAALVGAGLRILRRADVACSAIALPSTWEAYLATLPRSRRSNLRRHLRRLDEGAVVLREVRDGRLSVSTRTGRRVAMPSRRAPAHDVAVRAAVVLAVALLALVYVLFVGSDAGRAIDTALTDRDLQPKLAGLWLIVGAFFYLLLTPVGVVALVASLVWYARRRERHDAGLRGALVVVVSVVCARALKALLELADPVGGETVRQLGPAFYPSGHAAAAMALCLAAFLVFRDQERRLVALGGLWCTIHGFAIFASRSHHFSDVLGGFLVAFAVAATIMRLRVPRIEDGARIDVRGGLVMLAGVIAAMAAADLARVLSVASLSPRLVLAAAAVGLCAAAYALTFTFVRLLEPRAAGRRPDQDADDRSEDGAEAISEGGRRAHRTAASGGPWRTQPTRNPAPQERCMMLQTSGSATMSRRSAWPRMRADPNNSNSG
jgi:membrane-associated phospholipid phosphatase